MSLEEGSRHIENLRLSDGTPLKDFPDVYYEIVSMFEQCTNDELAIFIEKITENAPKIKDPTQLVFSCFQFDKARQDYDNTLLKRKEGIKHEPSDISCSRCHKKTVHYYQKQTRSGDEAMTTFNKCYSCGYGWRS